MHDGHKRSKKGSRDGAANSGSSVGQSASDATTEQLRKMGTKLGNEELQQRIQKGNATRDDLMAFIRTRLESVRGVQEKEILASDKRTSREYWRQISDQHKTDVTNPDASRWRETARLYEEAAYQLARGSLGRGKQLIDKAVAEEQRTFDKLSSIVHVTNEEREGFAEGCSAGADVDPNEACSATDVPSEIRELARTIENVTEKAPEVPWRRRTRDPWWTEEEEEEEEEEGGSGA